MINTMTSIDLYKEVSGFDMIYTMTLVVGVIYTMTSKIMV